LRYYRHTGALARLCGEDDGALLAAALSPHVQDRHRENIRDAIARGIFGSPTYFVRGDMFYGQDRLEMVARAIEKPFDP
jgi:2-hydroxychromene-2-carboxylate isomerase